MITTVYTPPAELVLHDVDGLLDNRETAPRVVHVMQYDNDYPIIAVHLLRNHQPYTLPEGISVNVRMRKPDGKNVYNPALGVSSDRQTVYVAVTLQMTAAHGKGIANVEITQGDRAIGTAIVIIEIDPNPVQSEDIESGDEYKTILEIVGEAQEAAKNSKSEADRAKSEADRSKGEADKSTQEANRSKSEADRAKSEADRSKDEADRSEEYGTNPAIPNEETGNWDIWDVETQKYTDSGSTFRGNLMYATFDINPVDGMLLMHTDSDYNGPKFQLNGPNLEVDIDGD